MFVYECPTNLVFSLSNLVCESPLVSRCRDYSTCGLMSQLCALIVSTHEFLGKGEPPGMIIAIYQIIKTWRLKMEFNTEALQPIAKQFAGLLMREQNLGESQGVRTLETDIRRG